jgi:hypothetical protein
VASWPELTAKRLRPESRRARLWRARVAAALLFAAAGAWSAIAPQVNFSLGERLHLGFETISTIAVILALIAGLRFAPRLDYFLKLTTLAAWQRRLSQFNSSCVQAGNELITALPFLLLLLALQAITLAELFAISALTALLLALSITLSMFRGPTLLLPLIAVALYARGRRPWFETSMIALYATHVYYKVHLTRRASARIVSENFAIESSTPLSPNELCRFNFLSRPIMTLAACHILLLLLSPFWPVSMEERLALRLVLTFGVFSLSLDSYALHWHSMLTGNAFQTISIVIGIPWAVAWMLAALHTGEAFTLNEAAAYFFVWSALGSILSWAVGNSAREKVQRNLREIISTSRESSPFPSLYP